MKSLQVTTPNETGLGKAPDDDEIMLHSANYEELFGVTFGEGQDSKPWKKRILVVTNPAKPSRTLRLRFRGSGSANITRGACGLSFSAINRLGLNGSDSESVLVRPAIEPFGRALFYWNHPHHHARVAFKLGAVALAIALYQVIRDATPVAVCAVQWLLGRIGMP